MARASRIKRWAPALVLVCMIAVAYFMGLERYLSLESIAANRDMLKAYVAQHTIAAVLLYMAAYIGVVGLSLPGAAAMSVLGGFLFGWAVSVPATIVAATTGAVLVFQVVKTSFGAAMAERAGPLAQKLAAGFAADAFNYLLFLRLTPVFPFFAVNAVAGLARVKLKTFILATIIGILPASFVFAYLGSGLDGIIDAQIGAHRACVQRYGMAMCDFSLDIGALLTPQIVISFAALGIIALLPVAIKRWKRPS